jgi:hypothetical protein
MLHTLPEELASSDLSRHTLDEIEKRLDEYGPGILSVIDQTADKVNNKTLNASKALYSMLGKVVKVWIASRAVTLSRFSSDYPHALQLVCQGVQTGDPDIVRESCAALRKVFALSEYPPSSLERVNVVQTVVSFLASSKDHLLPFFREAESDMEFGGGSSDGAAAVALEVVSTLTAILSQESSLLFGAQTCRIEVFELLLACVRHRPRTLAFLTFEFWVAITVRWWWWWCWWWWWWCCSCC